MAYNTIVKGYELPDTYEELDKNCLSCVVAGGDYKNSDSKCVLPEF
jgi:hypothetical protein